MPSKVIDISKGNVSSYEMLSQTPKNRAESNFFLKELQDKYDAEWKYAPNVVDVEYENEWGTEKYSWIEVRDQKIHTDKNKTYSDDVKRLVFRDIHEKRFRIGSKFRFSERFDNKTPEDRRSIWLATNASYSQPATSVVVTRCNGTLGFMVTDERGISSVFHEPVIFGGDLKGVSIYDNKTAFSPESELTAVMQHNERTARFYINQRFVIGYDQVYRVKGLNKFYSQSTYDPKDAGLMVLYLEIVEKSEKDEFGDDLLAYNETHDIVMEPSQKGGDVSIVWKKPQEFPTALPSAPTEFSAQAAIDGSETQLPLTFDVKLQNLPEGVDMGRYVESEVSGNSIILKKLRQYPNGGITVTATLPAAEYGGEEDYSVSFTMKMGGI